HLQVFSSARHTGPCQSPRINRRIPWTHPRSGARDCLFVRVSGGRDSADHLGNRCLDRRQRAGAGSSSAWMAGATCGGGVGGQLRQRRRAVRCLSHRVAQPRPVPVSDFPIALHGERLIAVVIGGGTVGTRKALALVDAGASVSVVSPVVTPELEDAMDRRRLTIIREAYRREHLERATLVI